MGSFAGAGEGLLYGYAHSIGVVPWSSKDTRGSGCSSRTTYGPRPVPEKALQGEFMTAGGSKRTRTAAGSDKLDHAGGTPSSIPPGRKVLGTKNGYHAPMEAGARNRQAGLFLVVVGSLIIATGLVGVSGVLCPRGLQSCPASGCVNPIPACPSPLAFDVFGTLALVGACILVPSGLLLFRANKPPTPGR